MTDDRIDYVPILRSMAEKLKNCSSDAEGIKLVEEALPSINQLIDDLGNILGKYISAAGVLAYVTKKHFNGYLEINAMELQDYIGKKGVTMDISDDKKVVTIKDKDLGI